MSECPPQVLELISFLGKSGTGKAKLDKLMALGYKCNGAEEFLAKAAKLVPPGTMAKINTYVASQEVQGKEPMVIELSTPLVIPQEESKGDKVVSSPVADMNAKDAIEFIKMMDDKAGLELILNTEERVTVKEAASKHLESLSK